MLLLIEESIQGQKVAKGKACLSHQEVVKFPSKSLLAFLRIFVSTLHHTADPTMGDDEDVPVPSGIGRGRGRGGVPVLPAGTKLVERDS